MFTLQTSFKPLLLKGGWGGGIENPLAKVTVNSKEGPRIWPLFNMNSEEEEGYRRGKNLRVRLCWGGGGGGGKLIFVGGG
jgi:hypothetical protein